MRSAEAIQESCADWTPILFKRARDLTLHRMMTGVFPCVPVDFGTLPWLAVMVLVYFSQNPWNFLTSAARNQNSEIFKL
jgi:hypothetical protein